MIVFPYRHLRKIFRYHASITGNSHFISISMVFFQAFVGILENISVQHELWNIMSVMIQKCVTDTGYIKELVPIQSGTQFETC